MRIYRATYTDEKNVLHTYVFLTSSQLAKVMKEARKKGLTARVEKLEYNSAYVSKQT